MYILAKLLKGFSKPLTYKLPIHMQNKNLVGKIINVPIKNKIHPAIVLKKYEEKPNVNFAIKEIFNIEKLPDDKLYHKFIKQISDFYFVDYIHFYRRIHGFLNQKKSKENKENLHIQLKIDSKPIQLTREQKSVIDYMAPSIKKNKYTPTLIYGATGSGKTEVYKELIKKNFEQHKTTILIHPEVCLCIQFQNLLKQQLPESIRIFGFHSTSKTQEKKEMWKAILENKPILILGVHLPILLPISNLGLIIVDEEHEKGFLEKKHPKLNSKEISVWRASFYKIPILLGSATPSLNSLYNIKMNNWKLFELKKRFYGQFPKIQKVLLTQYKNRGKNFWICRQLQEEINKKLQKKEQIIIYLNRRGYSFFVQCKQCAFIPTCTNCSVSLTLHENKILRCHYCNYSIFMPAQCPECKAENKQILKKGVGTQKIVSTLQQLFPEAQIARADLDTTRKKQEWKKILQNFEDGKIDILVGTQTITKGYHFPNVTLVGIIWADLNLNFPIFNATETSLQQLIQVAGRAGRSNKKSTVIVQTMQDHEVFKFLNEQDYLKFCSTEFTARKQTNYPPFARLVQIELKNINPEILENESTEFATKLKELKLKLNSQITILGPSKPIVYKIAKMESRQIFIKSKSFKQVFNILKKINFEKFKSSIFVVPTQ